MFTSNCVAFVRDHVNGRSNQVYLRLEKFNNNESWSLMQSSHCIQSLSMIFIIDLKWRSYVIVNSWIRRKGKYISHQSKFIFGILSVCVHSKFNDTDYCTTSLAWTLPVSLVLLHYNIYHFVIVTVPTWTSQYISWWVWWLLPMHYSVAILE